MPSLIDLTGKKFGHWTVLERAENKGRKVAWLCKCQCGKEKVVLGDSLRRGASTSCGCMSNTEKKCAAARKNIISAQTSNTIDLTGQRFGRLTVICRDSRKGEQAFWKCQCDCGNEVVVGSYNLRSGGTKSCGCYKKEVCSNLGKEKLLDITGQRFGKLVALHLDQEKDSSNHLKWVCQCDCGNITSVRTSSLTSGNTKSCGICSHISFGEEKIRSLLEEHGIFYEYQKRFQDCRYPDSNKLVSFDFYVDNRYIIEFDGRQHFSATGGWNTQAVYEKTVEHDKFRSEWCKNHNIPILRIPYTMLETLVFDDIWIN